MDARENRRALNEVLFREVNERIQELTTDLGGESEQDGAIRIVCECGNENCTAELIETTRAEYEAVRSSPRRFLVLPGHEHTDAARIVERNNTFSVIEKIEGAGEVAVEHDPRS